MSSMSMGAPWHQQPHTMIDGLKHVVCCPTWHAEDTKPGGSGSRTLMAKG